MIRFLVSSVFLFLLFVSSVAGQWVSYPTSGVPRKPNGKPNLSAPFPRTADGKPDLSGLWEMEDTLPAPPAGLGCLPVSREFVNIGSSLKDGLPYQPRARELVNKRKAEQRLNDPFSHCLPAGVMRLHTYPGPRKMIQAPGLLVVLNEPGASYRQIFTDGRPLPADPNPSWNGYSSGRWDGDVLIVQSNGFRDGLWLDAAGSPLTDAAKIAEKFRRLNFGKLEIEVTVDDPKAYTRPWTIKFNQTIKLDTDLLDYICNENEKDLQHFVVK